MRNINTIPDELTIGDNLKKAVAQMLVLHLICEKDRYINEIIQEIRIRTDDTLILAAPYALIMKLQDSGKIAGTEKRIAPDGRLRQYYCITPKGRSSLVQQKQIYKDYCIGVKSVLQISDCHSE